LKWAGYLDKEITATWGEQAGELAVKHENTNCNRYQAPQLST